MNQLTKLTKAAAKKGAWKTLKIQVMATIIEKIAKTLGMRLTRAKVAQLLPIAGAAVGGTFNALYTGRVCEAAYHLYREQFLIRRYGEAILEEPEATGS